MTETGELLIRPFRADDSQLVRSFFDDMGSETRFFFNRGDINRKFADRFFLGTAKNALYFLAEDDGRMVGYVYLRNMNRAMPELGIAVREEYKGRHLGRRLIACAQERAAAEGKAGIRLTTHPDNIRGQRLYERMGFRKQEGRLSRYGELLYDWTVPEK